MAARKPHLLFQLNFFFLEKEVRLACSHSPLASTDYVSPVEGIGVIAARVIAMGVKLKDFEDILRVIAVGVKLEDFEDILRAC